MIGSVRRMFVGCRVFVVCVCLDMDVVQQGPHPLICQLLLLMFDPWIIVSGIPRVHFPTWRLMLLVTLTEKTVGVRGGKSLSLVFDPRSTHNTIHWTTIRIYCRNHFVHPGLAWSFGWSFPRSTTKVKAPNSEHLRKSAPNETEINHSGWAWQHQLHHQYSVCLLSFSRVCFLPLLRKLLTKLTRTQKWLFWVT